MENIFIQGLLNTNEYDEIQNAMTNHLSPVAIHGLTDSQIAHIAFLIHSHFKKQCLMITHSEYQAKIIYENLKNFEKEKIYFYPSKELTFYHYDAHSHEGLEERIKSMIALSKGEKCLVIASIEGLLQPIMPKSLFSNYHLKVEYGQQLNIKEFIGKLVLLGYERVDMVEAKGQFSVRGGIIDFFPVVAPNPYRIELFDDEVDSIRAFDFYSQLSLEKQKQVRIYPTKEVILDEATKNKAVENIKNGLKHHASKLEGDPRKRLEEKIHAMLEKLENQEHPKGIENYLYDYYGSIGYLTDYLREDGIILMDESSRIEEKAHRAYESFYQSFEDFLEKGEVLPSQVHLMNEWEDFYSHIQTHKKFLFSMLPKKEVFSVQKKIEFSSRIPQSFQGKMDLFINYLKKYKASKYKIILLCGTKERAKNLEKELLDKGMECVYAKSKNTNIQLGQIIILTGHLREGFEYVSNKFMVITEDEIFGSRKRKRKSKKRKDARPIKSFMDLKVGQYVVHENHGIGQYVGVEQLKVQNAKKDYLKVKYAGEDMLYVPIEQMDLVQKYIGSDSDKPKLNKMGGVEWKKTKAKVKGAIVDMAKDLLKLHAIRQTHKGHAFKEDTPWQKEFEDSFSYEETPDQLRCIEEIKKDMESPIPMDRLLCGDVGYGKTEVAVRAAFKCVMEGKQVAFLVPTTILAQQHYSTFKERFKQFPITIQMLSRFKSETDQQHILKDVQVGAVDVLIGTHRILSKDVAFKDLGVLIIDEEQRFGVQHKEALKTLRENVDVLTLTATPIPRTLHMSLIGLRDMSVIEEPPDERYPVQTYVLEYHDDVIRDSILRELGRGGQVYFVFNRVKGIQQMASKLRALLPEAKIAVAHGQMNERMLENIMFDFLQGEYDVLVCTTIIETGLDIPNVNTIIIHDADKIGLSQLYQLRGRVGRSNRLAYAYLTYEKDKILTEIAEKRLKAIKEFTEFGSGFKIAMRDLEIRGAGNLLGSQQHGHMAAIGYDLYCKLLEETVKEMQGESIEPKVETSVEIQINAYIPKHYITNENHKLEIYKKIAAIKNKEDVFELEEEIQDRFGDIPNTVIHLIHIAYMKALAQRIGIIRILDLGNDVRFELGEISKMNPLIMSKMIEYYKTRVQINAGNHPYIKLKYYFVNQKFKEIEHFLEKISSFF